MTTRITFLLLLAATGCSKSNPYYCESAPDNNCALQADAGSNDGDPAACVSSSECAASSPGLPVCDTASNTCVACTSAESGACGGRTPVCASNACTSCVQNSECASGACMPDGSCADPGRLLFASPGGISTSCSSAANSCSLTTALAAVDPTHDIIVLSPELFQLGATLTLGSKVTLLGRGATLKASANDGPAVSVTSGANVEIHFATITGANNIDIGHGIQCSNATLVVTRATIRGNEGRGIAASACAMTLDRSTLYLNMLGGIRLEGSSSPYSITNNFIYDNGNTSLGSTVGGVGLLVTAPNPARFEFNTLIRNKALVGATNTGGVECLGQITAPHNIVAENQEGTSTLLDVQTHGDCSFPMSIVQTDLAGLDFVSTGAVPYDLHLGPGSIARNYSNMSTSIDYDWDGQPRPSAGKDVGADEAN